MDRLTGQSWIYNSVLRGESAAAIAAKWQPGLEKFKAIREKYLLYK